MNGNIWLADRGADQMDKEKGRAVHVRRCVCCHKSADKYSLWRFVVNEEGRLLWDQRYDMQGRGAYIHPEARCLSRFGDCKKWARALRVSGSELDAVALKQLKVLLDKFLTDEGAVAQSRTVARLRL